MKSGVIHALPRAALRC